MMNLFKKKPIEYMNAIDLECANRKLEMIKPVYDWVLSSINKEAKRIVEESSHATLPTKLYLKYQMEPEIRKYMTVYGPLDIIIDPEMKGILRVE